MVAVVPEEAIRFSLEKQHDAALTRVGRVVNGLNSQETNNRTLQQEPSVKEVHAWFKFRVRSRNARPIVNAANGLYKCSF